MGSRPIVVRIRLRRFSTKSNTAPTMSVIMIPLITPPTMAGTDDLWVIEAKSEAGTVEAGEDELSATVPSAVHRSPMNHVLT